MGSRKAAFIFGLFITTAVFIIVYAAAVPYVVSHRYEDRIHAAARPLKSSIQALNKSVEFPLIIDSDAPEKVKTENALHILQLIDDSERQLDALKTAASNLTISPYSDALGQYTDAKVLKDHTKRFIGQSEDALENYKALTAYLTTFYGVVGDVSSELSSFNSVIDINEYSGQAETIRQIASRIRADAASLASAAHPADTEILNTAAVTAIDQAASGFDDLAYGLFVPADDPIYAAARKIEAATADLDEVTGRLYDNALDQSRIIKNVEDLSDKLELIASR